MSTKKQSEKVIKTGITRDKECLYYLKADALMCVRRAQAGKPKAKPEMVKKLEGFERDSSRYIYFVDKDGDVARSERANYVPKKGA